MPHWPAAVAATTNPQDDDDAKANMLFLDTSAFPWFAPPEPPGFMVPSDSPCQAQGPGRQHMAAMRPWLLWMMPAPNPQLRAARQAPMTSCTLIRYFLVFTWTSQLEHRALQLLVLPGQPCTSETEHRVGYQCACGGKDLRVGHVAEQPVGITNACQPRGVAK